MWWILQIIGIVLITVALTFARWYSQTFPGASIFIPWISKVLIEIIAAFCFIKSYALAPSFFQPWFLGTAAISLLGFIASLIFFGEAVTIIKIVGAALVLSGAVLLIL